MQKMNLSSMNLNLLVTLDALIQERHVGRAAISVGRSQPAVSHALSRLRTLFADPLLVQSGRRMVLTPRAEAIQKPLAKALADVGTLFKSADFNPAECSKTFRLMMPDCFAGDLIPGILERVSQEAPEARIEVTEWRGAKTLTREFLDGIDLVVSAWTGRYVDFVPELLFIDRDVTVVRLGRSRRALLRTTTGFCNAMHVAVVGPGEHEDMVDNWLRTLGYTRKIAAIVPTYALAFDVVAQSDLIAFVPERLVRKAGRHPLVQSVESPFASANDDVFLHFPAIAEADAASKWLRAIVRDVALPKKRRAQGKRR